MPRESRGSVFSIGDIALIKELIQYVNQVDKNFKVGIMTEKRKEQMANLFHRLNRIKDD